MLGNSVEVALHFSRSGVNFDGANARALRITVLCKVPPDRNPLPASGQVQQRRLSHLTVPPRMEAGNGEFERLRVE